jgi:hypothetical protein
MQNTNNNISKIKINVVISTRISFTKLIVERKQLIADPFLIGSKIL